MHQVEQESDQVFLLVHILKMQCLYERLLMLIFFVYIRTKYSQASNKLKLQKSYIYYSIMRHPVKS